jgi:hypothetical protein
MPMTRRLLITVALAGIFLSGLAATASAQLEANLGALSGENAKGYLSPLPNALSTTMNSAVFRSGYVPKMGLNFEIGVGVMGISFDKADRTYTPVDPAGFQSTEQVTAPTIIGDTQAVEQQGQAGTVLYHPGGFDIDNFTVAVPQLMIGSVAGTRAVVRYISLDLGDTDLGKFKLWGLGAQHSISQYFPTLPVDLAVGAFYQQFKIGDNDLVKTNAFHADVTGSRRFGVLQPYAAVGFDTFGMRIKYTSQTVDPDQKIDVKFDNKTHAHLTGGVLATLAFVRLNAEFDIAAENGLAVGLSFGK